MHPAMSGQLQHDVPHQRPSYEVLARLAPYKDVFLVIDLITSLTSRPAYFVIKQVSVFNFSFYLTIRFWIDEMVTFEVIHVRVRCDVVAF